MRLLRKITLFILFIFLGFLFLRLPFTFFAKTIYGIPNIYVNLFFWFILQAVTVVCIFLLLLLFACKLDGQSLKEIGVTFGARSVKLFLIGFLITAIAGILTWAIYFVLYKPVYHLQIHGFTKIGLVILLSLMLGVMQAAAEELLFRSWALKVLGEMTGTGGAILLCGVIFGGLHLFNPGYSILGILSASFAGIMLSAAYFKTRSVALPIGLHMGWNFILSGVLYNHIIFHSVSKDGKVLGMFNAAEGTIEGVIIVGVLALIFVIVGQQRSVINTDLASAATPR